MSVQGFDEGEVLTGEREFVSPVTGRPYVVTEWVEHGEGRVTALEKRPVEDRLFVPLKTGPYRLYEQGLKDIEIRGYCPRFNMETVVPGRWAELRRGYATNDSLWRLIDHVHQFDHITNIADHLDHHRIIPGAPRDAFEDHVRELLGEYSRWIAFKLARPALPGGTP